VVRKFELDDIDIAGQEAGLAVAEIDAPQAAEGSSKPSAAICGQLLSKRSRHTARVRA
jgi:hypothetical protein